VTEAAERSLAIQNHVGILEDGAIPRLHARVIVGAVASRPDIKAAV